MHDCCSSAPFDKQDTAKWDIQVHGKFTTVLFSRFTCKQNDWSNFFYIDGKIFDKLFSITTNQLLNKSENMKSSANLCLFSIRRGQIWRQHRTLVGSDEGIHLIDSWLVDSPSPKQRLQQIRDRYYATKRQTNTTAVCQHKIYHNYVCQQQHQTSFYLTSIQIVSATASLLQRLLQSSSKF